MANGGQFTVLACGSRHWTNKYKIMSRLLGLKRLGSVLVLEGGQLGADTICRQVALELGYDVQTYWANWTGRGRMAGPYRNRVMLDRNPRIVIAFHEDITQSKGTADVLREAKLRNIETELHT